MMREFVKGEFDQVLLTLSAARSTQSESAPPKPMTDADWLFLKTFRSLGVLEEVNGANLVDAAVDTCGDDERVWENFGFLRRCTKELNGHAARFFPLSSPGGPLLAHPKVCEVVGQNYFDQLVQKIMMTYVAKGHTVYKAIGHVPCGVAGILEIKLDEMVELLLELCQLLEESLAAKIPGFEARALLHADRRGHIADPSDWMKTYRVVAGNFQSWRETGSPIYISTMA